MKDLCQHAKCTTRLRQQHFTVNFDNVLNPTAKIMDASIADPHDGSRHYVDFHVFDPTAPTARRIKNPIDPNSQINSSLQHSQRAAVRKKVVTYRCEVRPPQHRPGWCNGLNSEALCD